MSNDVFANGREISCKAGSGKSICAFPDVCMTPPQTPATPPGVPIPYPNTGKAGDATSGSKKVKISKKEVVLKNKSYFKSSMGDEAGSAPMKGVVTHKTKGKVYFNAWSMDVKFEGENVVRHLDLTTHNHGSGMNTPPWPYMDEAAMAEEDHPCDKSGDKEKVKNSCTKTKKPEDDCTEPCKSARKCVLVGFPEGSNKPSASPGQKQKFAETYKCCDGKTPHHAIPFAAFATERAPGGSGRGTPQIGNYNENDAPCMCVEGKNHNGKTEHALAGKGFSLARDIALSGGDPKKIPPNGTEYDYEVASQAAADSLAKVTGCDSACLKRQIDDGHKKMNVPTDTAKVRKSKQFGGGEKNVKAAVEM